MPDPNDLVGMEKQTTEEDHLVRKVPNKTPWDELTVDQKLERMRGIIKELQHTLEWQSRRFADLEGRLVRLEEHAHTDGKVMIPVVSKRRGVGCGEVREERIEGWF